jgi:hypothetical protein
MSIIYYLIAGSLFSAIIDVSAHFTNATRMNNIERICVIVFWPIWFIFFIYHLINEMRGR